MHLVVPTQELFTSQARRDNGITALYIQVPIDNRYIDIPPPFIARYIFSNLLKTTLKTRNHDKCK